MESNQDTNKNNVKIIEDIREPRISDYYNSDLSCFKVMEKIDTEYERALQRIKELEKENKILREQQKILEKYKKPPMLDGITLLFDFEDAAKDYIDNIYPGNDEEIDLGVDLLDDYQNLNERVYDSHLYTNGRRSTPYKKKSLIHSLIDLLDKFTNHQNYEWCRIKVLSACESHGIYNTQFWGHLKFRFHPLCLHWQICH